MTTTEAKTCDAETYSGSRLHEQVRRFTWEGRWLEVAQVLASWREPRRLCFQVAVADGRVFFLQYDPARETWSAAPARRGQGAFSPG